MRPPTLPTLALSLLMLLGCGGSRPPRPATDADLRSLTEAEARQIIETVLLDAGVTPVRGQSIDVGDPEPLAVDMRLEGLAFAVEWVSAQDRADRADSLPRPDPDGQLRTVGGSIGADPVQVLLLEHSSYRYDPDAERVRRGSTGVREAESRLRRDVGDFLVYARGQ